MQVKKVPVGKIKPSAHNPKTRTALQSLVSLSKSIESVGLIYPLAVSKDMHLIDGHRRLAAVKTLDWTAVPVLVVAADDADLVYAEINATGRTLSGAENLQVWLKNAAAVTVHARLNFERARDVYGMAILRHLAKHNLGVRVLRVATVIAEYVDCLDDVEFRRSIVRWMMSHRMQSVARAYVLMQQPPKTLYNAIKNDKPLKAQYSYRD